MTLKSTKKAIQKTYFFGIAVTLERNKHKSEELNMNFTTEQINEAAKEYLHNNCENIELGKLSMAVWGHSAVFGTQTAQDDGKEVLFVQFSCNGDDLTAKISSKESELVELYSDYDDHPSEYCGKLTRSAFFLLFSSMTNIYAYLDNADSPTRAMAIQLLQYYQRKN